MTKPYLTERRRDERKAKELFVHFTRRGFHTTMHCETDRRGLEWFVVRAWSVHADHENVINYHENVI